jgi:hypothetical protein
LLYVIIIIIIQMHTEFWWRNLKKGTI